MRIKEDIVKIKGSRLRNKMRTERNQYGYIRQKGNRYFIKVGASTNHIAGFKTKEQFEEWIKEEFKSHGLDWRAGYSWKYKDSQNMWELTKKDGTSVRHR